MKRLSLLICLIVVTVAHAGERWTPEKANAWQKSTGWLVGCNYITSTAINQLEMWQADTFDPKTIDRELGWAESLGFNSIRVFLHNIAWEEDHNGFLDRMDKFLEIAQRHHIGVMFVPLDAVWDPYPKAGKQRDPQPHVHNSGWVQCPSADILCRPERHAELEGYIKAIFKRFKNDARVHAWDLYNEPDNTNKSAYGKVELKNKAEMSLLLITKVFDWAREVNPSQPCTSGVWIGNWPDVEKLSPMERYQLENSDVISFHTYAKLGDAEKCVEHLRRYGRPLLCTEYMARPAGSTFDPILGYFKSQNVAAYNWGFVDGKSQTIYPWDSWTKAYTGEPPLWFHDIFRRDGRPYRQEEVEYIRATTGKILKDGGKDVGKPSKSNSGAP